MHATTYVTTHTLRGDRIDLAGVPLSRALPRPSEYFAYKGGNSKNSKRCRPYHFIFTNSVCLLEFTCNNGIPCYNAVFLRVR